MLLKFFFVDFQLGIHWDSYFVVWHLSSFLENFSHWNNAFVSLFLLGVQIMALDVRPLHCILMFLLFLKKLILDWEKHRFVASLIYAFVGWFLPWPGIEPTTSVYWDDALTNLSTIHPVRASSYFLPSLHSELFLPTHLLSHCLNCVHWLLSLFIEFLISVFVFFNYRISLLHLKICYVTFYGFYVIAEIIKFGFHLLE